jgi:hypothetical protein
MREQLNLDTSDNARADEGSNTGGNTVGTQNASRLAMFERMADASEAVRAKEGEVFEPIDADVDPNAPAGNPNAPEDPRTIAARLGVPFDQEDEVDVDVAAAKVEHPEPAKPEDKHKVKINGAEVELTTAELIAKASKVASADVYLQQAKEAADRALALRDNREPSKDVHAVEEDDLALARAVQMGTEEEAAQAIRALRAKAPSIDVDVLAAQIEAKRSFQEAGNWVKTEYSDLAADPDLWNMFLLRDQQMVAAQDGRAYKDRYKAIGDELRAKFKPGAASKEQRKSATVLSLPTASARVAKPAEDDTEESPSSVVAQMARARGQQIRQ